MNVSTEKGKKFIRKTRKKGTRDEGNWNTERNGRKGQLRLGKGRGF
jgi:hypothetical protein